MSGSEPALKTRCGRVVARGKDWQVAMLTPRNGRRQTRNQKFDRNGVFDDQMSSEGRNAVQDLH